MPSIKNELAYNSLVDVLKHARKKANIQDLRTIKTFCLQMASVADYNISAIRAEAVNGPEDHVWKHFDTIADETLTQCETIINTIE